MTNPIPPCPVCGTVPDQIPETDIAVVSCCSVGISHMTIRSWCRDVSDALRVALSEKYDIHTLAELESRLAPKYLIDKDGVVGVVPTVSDPRVAASEPHKH